MSHTAQLRTLAAKVERREEIRQSRFYAIAAPLAAADQAADFLAAHHEPDATHHCFAWRYGQQYRSDDAGEPAGTAGRPILHAIERQGYDQVIVLVIRWFGGIKLGAGGLVRAYGGIAARLLNDATAIPLIVQCTLVVDIPHAAVAILHHLAARHEAVIENENWRPASVHYRLRLPAARSTELSAALLKATAGAAVFESSPAN